MKNKIGFIWQGITEHYHHWEDGLRKAMDLLEQEYDIEYIEPDADLSGYDVVLYWESPCTELGENQRNWLNVKHSSTKKILLFAGGPIQPQWVEGFDLICVESKINKDEFKAIGWDTTTAFGINTELMKPMDFKKEFIGVHHGTCASWKRQDLLGEAFKDKALLIGRRQKHDTYCFDRAKDFDAKILPEMKGIELVSALNSAEVLVQTSDFWGGGQRATLEAMACGIPVICMDDSPKNREYVEESGAGLVCSPNPEDIRKTYELIKKDYKTYSKNGIDYVNSKWTHFHYAQSLKQAIQQCLSKN